MRASVRNLIVFHFSLATIKLSDFNKILSDEFKGKKPSESLVQCMFESKSIPRYNLLGFKTFKFSDGGHEIDRNQLMDVLDFLLAMNFLARLIYEKKMRCIISLTNLVSDV